MRLKPTPEQAIFFTPARLGGLAGFGVQKYGKPSPLRFGALSPRGSLSDNPRPDRVYSNTVTETAKQIDPETVKARARVVSLRLLDETESRATSMDDGDLVSALGQALKASGAIVAPNGGAGLTLNVAQLHLDSLRRMRAPEAQATLLPSNEVASGVTVSDAVVVSDDDTTGCA
jgi:hypothetical protein